MSYSYELALASHGFSPVAGADEAGRGASAGPLVAAAVILTDEIPGLNDSKKLTARARDHLYEQILATALAISVVRVEPSECDSLGLQEANLQALRRALLKLDPSAGFALVDGYSVSGLGFPALAIWKGDQVVKCVSAASIVAKVTRDRIMIDYDEQYPGYGFAVHKGYNTAVHQRALEDLGPCDIHRMSYANVAKAIRVGAP